MLRHCLVRRGSALSCERAGRDGTSPSCVARLQEALASEASESGAVTPVALGSCSALLGSAQGIVLGGCEIPHTDSLLRRSMIAADVAGQRLFFVPDLRRRGIPLLVLEHGLEVQELWEQDSRSSLYALGVAGSAIYRRSEGRAESVRDPREEVKGHV